jgi:predicted CopG family antitoxin
MDERRYKALRKYHLTNGLCDVHIEGMGVRTISLKDEAYGRLRAARRYPDESFSEVVLRATWPEDTITGRALLALLASRRGHLRPEELDRIESATERDTPPEDKWASN